MHFILCFIFSLGLIFAKDEPIVIQLATDCQLLPIYVDEFEGSGLEADYLKKLEEVLCFDLNHNGFSLVKKNKAKSPSDSSKYAKFCKDQAVFYLLKGQIKDKNLSIQVFSLNNQQVKAIDGVPLNGLIENDRRQIHQLANVIQKELFGKSGVADTRILYTLRKNKTKNEWSSEVWEADYDGQNARKVSKDGDYCLTPTYLPPLKGKLSRNFFYVSYKTGQPKIYFSSLVDGITQRLCYLKGNQFMPAVSPLRDQVAFISDAGGNPDLFIQPFKAEEGILGKPRQVYSNLFATQGSPTFSPDGKKLAFVSNKDGSPRIYVMELPKWGESAKKIEPQIITKYSQESTAPSWSPDGSKLAYSALTEGVRQIWVYDFNKKEEKQLTRGVGNKENPSWAPNSLHLIYNSSDAGASELYVVNLNYPDPIKISQGDGEKRFPCWEKR